MKIRNNPRWVSTKQLADYRRVIIRVKPVFKEYRFKVRAGYRYRRGRKIVRVPAVYESGVVQVRKGYSYKTYIRIKREPEPPREHEYTIVDDFLGRLEKKLHAEYKKEGIFRPGSKYLPRTGGEGVKMASPRYLYVEPSLQFNWSFFPETKKEEYAFYNAPVHDLVYVQYYVRVYKSVQSKLVFTFSCLQLPRLMSVNEIAKSVVGKYMAEIMDNIAASRKGIEFVRYAYFSVAKHREKRGKK